MSSIRLGMIGAGQIALFTSREFRRHAGCEIPAVADPNAERAAELAVRKLAEEEEAARLEAERLAQEAEAAAQAAAAAEAAPPEAADAVAAPEGEAGEAELLTACYRNSLDLASRHQLRSIAFPAISTGVFGYPLAEATAIAVATVADFVATTPLLARFVCFDARTARAYREEIAAQAG